MINIALVGNPNVGKTTLYNALTGSKQYVGNWAGVTIEKKEGYLTSDIKIVDLPGIYALDTFSNEEKVSKAYLQSDEVDIILNIVDASNLARNLYLTTQLSRFNKPIIILLNMMDVAKERGCEIDVEALSKELGIRVMPLVARKKIDIRPIEQAIYEVGETKPVVLDFGKNETEAYHLLDELIEKVTLQTEKNKKNYTEKIDRWVLNPILAYPIFLCLLFLIFKLTFNWVGTPLSDLMEGWITEGIMPWLEIKLALSSEWFRSLIIDGVVGGVGGIIVFFPLIFMLFLGLSFLEDSGYMARAALIMDKIMAKVGLSGKAFIPLIMGFGCSTPAIMATRTLESEKDRRLTALIAPIISCNARLPVYALFASIFFVGKEEWVVLSLYMLTVVVAILVALLLKNTVFNKHIEPFLLELPEYKLPTLQAILRNTWNKSKEFLIRAGTLIFAISVLVWFLTSFNGQGFTTDIQTSFLAQIGKVIAPIFKPLGFGTWEIGVSVLTGLAAKEVIIGTMGVIYGDLTVALPLHFTALTAYTLMIFIALYTPCVSVLATLKKEYGKKMMVASLIYQFVLAWIIAFIFKVVSSWILGYFTIRQVGEAAITIAVMGLVVFILYQRFWVRKSGCGNCCGCQNDVVCHKDHKEM